MVGPKSTQTRVVGIITEIHPYIFFTETQFPENKQQGCIPSVIIPITIVCELFLPLPFLQLIQLLVTCYINRSTPGELNLSMQTVFLAESPLPLNSGFRFIVLQYRQPVFKFQTDRSPHCSVSFVIARCYVYTTLIPEVKCVEPFEMRSSEGTGRIQFSIQRAASSMPEKLKQALRYSHEERFS